jgi:hypothetical protein
MKEELASVGDDEGEVLEVGGAARSSKTSTCQLRELVVEDIGQKAMCVEV